MSQLSLEQIVGHIEHVYGMWEKFEIETGAAIDLLKLLVSDCRRVTEQTPTTAEHEEMLKQRVHDLVNQLCDTWRAHVEEELAEECDEH
jgi:hypothetical protein